MAKAGQPAGVEGEILFYSQRNKWGEFSNFWPATIYLEGVAWPTTEHYFQAQKFAGQDGPHVEQIRACKGPGAAARAGRSRKRPLRPDWEKVKDDIMLRCVHAKFTQHKDLQQTLLSTGNADLIEHTHNDRYWADGGDGTGRNQLGKILVQVREMLRNGEEYAEE